MSEERTISPAAKANLLRLGETPADARAALVQRLFDPIHIRAALRKESEKRWLDEYIQGAVPGDFGQNPIVLRTDLTLYQQPSPVRAARICDLLEAVLGIPAIRDGIRTLKERADARARNDWRHLPTGGKAGILALGVTMSSAVVTALLASKEGRAEVYGLLRDREIAVPIPGVPWLKIQLKSGKEHKAMILLDLPRF